MTTHRSAIAAQVPGRIFFPGRTGSLSSQIVGRRARRAVRQEAQARRFPRHRERSRARAMASAASSRATRCARCEALGIVEIKMGKGGGARIARGNPRLFAEALAVQLDLTGVSAAEIMDAQRAIECLAAELAAENATEADLARLKRYRRRRAAIDDPSRYTQFGRAISISRSPRPRTTACWWCSSSRCSMCHGRARTDADARGGAPRHRGAQASCSR